jgi:hypothetical protein
MSAPAQGIKALVHERAQALLHGDEVFRSREVQEVEVESAVHVVCAALGSAVTPTPSPTSPVGRKMQPSWTWPSDSECA